VGSKTIVNSKLKLEVLDSYRTAKVIVRECRCTQSNRCSRQEKVKQVGEGGITLV